MNRHADRARSAAEDMLRLCLKIERLMSGMSESQFLSTETTLDSVILAIANIGEAAKRFIDAVPDADLRFSALKLHGLYSMRNRVIHGYDVVDFRRVWETASRSVPLIRVALETLLANWPSDIT